MRRIIAVGLSATLQKTIVFKELKIDGVNRSKGYRIDASGKAVNAARVLNQLEPGIVVNVCPLGEESAGLFLDLARRDGLAFDWIPVPGSVRCCYTLLEPGSGRATELVVGEPAGKTDFADASEKLLALLAKHLQGADALLLAGSRPAGYPEDICARICKLASDCGCIVMADFHGRDLETSLQRSIPAIIKINEEEFCGTFGLEFPLGEEKITKELAQRSGELGNTIVVTRGSQDTYAATKGKGFHQGVQAVAALNAIGCGDSFAAGFLYTWLEGGDTKAALEKGSWCAARNALNLRPGSILDAGAEGEQLW